MIRKRLHHQIYATVISSLVLVVIISAMTFWIVDKDESEPELRKTIGTFVMNALPDASSSDDQQQAALLELLDEIAIDASLYNQNGRLIASKGKMLKLPENVNELEGWKRFRIDNGWLIEFRDGRWLIVGEKSNHGPMDAILWLLLLLSSVALGIGIASYPFVRKLTRRLEILQSGVEKVGLGDLTVRVDVKGRDEIASLAHSFNNSTEQIERLVTSHKTLLANASHELRTPLSRIRLGLEMYQDTHDEKRLKALKSDILELDSLIEEIMLMSRLDNNSTGMTIEEVDLSAIITEEAAHHSDVTVNGTTEKVHGNGRLLRRVIQNLIANAFKHGAPPVEIKLDQSEDFVSFTVTDSGNGISPEEHTKIFERFYRGSDRQNVEGYGLGLPLVKQIVDAHNGEVEIMNSKGFSIQVRLPIQDTNFKNQ
jgi:signal transduction histidine kinase